MQNLSHSVVTRRKTSERMDRLSDSTLLKKYAMWLPPSNRGFPLWHKTCTINMLVRQYEWQHVNMKGEQFMTMQHENSDEKKRMTEKFQDIAERWVPDSYVIALVLSVITFFLAIMFTEASPYKIVQAWGQGFWTLLSFSMQMTLIVVTGYALATTPLCKKLITSLCGRPSSAPQVYLWGVILAAVGYYLNWGFGLIFAALITKELAKQAHRKGLLVDYRLLCGATWTPFFIWSMGLSSSAALLIATPDHFMAKDMGIIPVTQTLFSSYNLILTALSMVIIIVLFYKILPPSDVAKIKTMEYFHPEFLEEEDTAIVAKVDIKTPSQWFTHTPWFSYFIGCMFIVYLYYHFFELGQSLDINILNFLFLMMIIFLYGTPAKLLVAVKAATPASWGIILQFPFYAGIFGIMKFTGLVDIMAQWIIGFSTAATYPAIVAILTNVIGYFIPSGGSKWAIEAPFLIPAGHALGVPDAKTTVAYMFGCDWVGLIQPFFAVPFMAVTGLEFKDFVGYTFIAYLLLGVLTLVGLTFLPF